MSEADPVELLLRSARDEAVDVSFHVTGVMMQYYVVCERELWFESRDIEIDRDNPSVVRGTQVDNTAYEDKRRNLSIDGRISPDLLDDGRVVEVKPSSSLIEPARLQLLYYLWYLDRVAGVEKNGVLAHPREKKRETVELTDEAVQRVEDAIRGIFDVVKSDSPPTAEERPFCESCAYYDFCWSC
ncbi:CRISPR-associated protein Cas4 [Halanaeroarchaeum sulfurireducens]|uniref:CRISPR-associated protein Cas4 n=1 Tax=Halanaeroarchaeum sulfurireducens TaxID=1604004 RepID=A0A0F7P880_9EURY|nr:CRISPR-associated protein Cas4 [Halanaeroarchaeum sulfurireducens]AKH97361.1 CRISPR-associated protein Cas4 [Halanaeroarchaeum sulfurireducens]ALG81763.1 CRISPR-associated protein Cas4 [Halanaeroarchaeum sulfurireducens]